MTHFKTMKHALVIIDLQNDFLDGGSLAVPNSQGIVAAINQIQPQFDLVIATQDWHPSNHQSFANNHPHKKPFDQILLHGATQTLWPEHCIQGTMGADFPTTLNTNHIAAIFRKGMDPKIDSYSGFYDNARHHKTGLCGYLKEQNIDKLYFCGLAADICVYYSILDALEEGFLCCLIENATCALNLHNYQQVKQDLLARKVEIKSIYS